MRGKFATKFIIRRSFFYNRFTEKMTSELSKVVSENSSKGFKKFLGVFKKNP